LRNSYKIYSKNLKGRDHLRDVGVEGRKFTVDLKKWGLRMWTGFIWLKSGSSGGILWTWKWTFGFHKWRKRLAD